MKQSNYWWPDYSYKDQISNGFFGFSFEECSSKLDKILAELANLTSGQTNNQGETNNTPQENNQSESGQTDNGGNTGQTSGTTDQTNAQESATTFSLSNQFDFNLVWSASTNFDVDANTLLDAIQNELLDYSSAEITLSGDNGYKLTITDLSQTYDLPDGTYTANGWIGRPYNSDYGDHNFGKCTHDTPSCILTPNQTISIDGGSQTIDFTIQPNESIILSDNPFVYKYTQRSSSPSTSSLTYNDISYLFVNNGCRTMGFSTMTYIDSHSKQLVSNGITYNIDFGFEDGHVYYFDGGNLI